MKPIKYISAIFLIILAVACGSKKPTVEQSEVKQHDKSSSDTTIIDVTKTPPLETKLGIVIGDVKTKKPECDSVCQAKIDEIMSRVEASQKSGKNETGIYYDKYKKTLYLYSKLQGTVDSITKHTHKEKEYYNITKYLKVTYTTNILTQEQKINLWVGRLFWVAFAVWCSYKIRKTFLPTK